MSPFEALAVVLGVAVLGLIVLGVRRSEFDAEAPKYEMLNLPVPPAPPPLAAGRLSPVDRIVRLGLIGACFYYAAHLGWGTPLGTLLAGLGAYLGLTGAWGQDPLYRWRSR